MFLIKHYKMLRGYESKRYIQLLRSLNTSLRDLIISYDDYFEGTVDIEVDILHEIYDFGISFIRMLSGNRIAVVLDEEIKIVHLENRDKDFYLRQHSQRIQSCCVLSDNCIASGDTDGNVIIWDLNSQESIDSFRPFESEMDCMTALSDNILLMSQLYGSFIKIYNVETQQSSIMTLYTHGEDIHRISSTQFAIYAGTTVKVYNIETQKIDYTIRVQDFHNYKNLYLMDDHTLLIIGNGIEYWDLKTQQIKHFDFCVLLGPIQKYISLSNNKLLLVGTYKSFALYDLVERRIEKIMDVDISLLKSIGVLSDGRLISSGNDNKLYIWN